MINQNFSTYNNYSSRENYQLLNNFKFNNRISISPIPKIINTNPNIQVPNLTQENKIPSPKLFFNNDMKNIKGLNNRNPNISNNFNNITHTLENKSINFDISKSVNYSKDLTEMNNENLSKNINITTNTSSIPQFNPIKIKNFFGPQIRSQSHNNNNNNKSIVSINNNNTSIHNNFQFLSNNDQKVSGISVQ
jgi:hypothetical protein